MHLKQVECVPEAVAVRRLARAGTLSTNTAGLAPGYVQANLAVLPSNLAEAFRHFCELNAQSCPVIGVGAPGSYRIPALGDDLDLRTDLPRYRVWQDGEIVDEPADIVGFWRDDLVAFALGCSFTFEAALMDEGIELRHVRQGRNVAMFRTNIDTKACGPFRGKMVVSMRPLRPADADRAAEITRRYPAMHGGPVHVGDPGHIGIEDLMRPDYGDAVVIAADEIPVFWACGVTPQAVIEQARPAFAMTHAPGCMLVTDRRHSEYCIH